MSFNQFIGILLVLSLILLSGCVSFYGDQLPQRSVTDLKPAALKPDVGYELKLYFLGALNPQYKGVYSDKFKKVLDESKLFSKVTEDEPQKVFFEVKLENDGNLTSGMITAVLCGLTLTILPAYARDEFTLSIAVKRDDVVLKEYKYKDHATNWIEFFLLLGMPFNDGPKKVYDNLIRNMFYNFLFDLQKDGILAD